MKEQTIVEIFKKEYDGCGIADIGRDLSEAFDPRFNENANRIIKDMQHIPRGTFILTLEYVPE
jgi:hypothetical protein